MKSPSSGAREKMLMGNLSQLNADDVVKFVVGSQEDLADMVKVLEQYPFTAKVYLSPVYGEIEPKELVEFVREHKLANVCVQVQLHKVIWDPAMRGV